MKNALKFIKEHECASLNTVDEIAITQYKHEGKAKWFWSFKKQLHQIKFCPYCGEALDKGDT